MFYGDSTHNMDGKNRVFVPKRFQEHLTRDSSGSLIAILMEGDDGCLYLFSESGFHEALKDLDTRAFTEDPELRERQRERFANTHRLTLDASGRLLIPEKLREIAALEREVVMLGVIHRAEIWSKAAWDEFERRRAERRSKARKSAG